MPLSSKVLIASLLVMTGALATQVIEQKEHHPGDDLLSHRVAVVGEMHGSVEIPGAFLDIVGRSIEKNGRVSVGLELPPDAREASCSSAGDNQRLGEFWLRDYQDGRSSRAMQALVCELQEMASAGQVRLLFLDRDSRNYAESYDRYAARMIQTEIVAHDQPVIVLTGNFHARNAPDSLVGFMRGMGLDVLSLTASAPVAETWNCDPSGDCRARRMTMNFCQIEASAPYVLSHQIEDDRWDGCVVLPRLTSSPPLADGQ